MTTPNDPRPPRDPVPSAGTTYGPAAPVPLDALLTEATARLADSAVSGARFGPRAEARALAAALLGISRESMLRDPAGPVSAEAAAAYRGAVRRRAAGEPLARITGRREFWSFEFELSDATLVPRPDSETLVQAALEARPDILAPLQILDFGVGSGCLLVALLAERPAARGIGIDISFDAAATARRNARRLGVGARADFVVGDWGAPIAGSFDLVVANPPYIADADRDLLAPEVREHDPATALFAGADGLDAYRSLAPHVFRLLADDGIAAVEVGAGQADDVSGIFQGAGLGEVAVRRDLSGVARVVLLAR